MYRVSFTETVRLLFPNRMDCRENLSHPSMGSKSTRKSCVRPEFAPFFLLPTQLWVVIRKTRIEKYVYKAINPFGQRQMFFKYIRRSRKWNKNSKRYVILNQDLDGSERPDHHVFLMLYIYRLRVCLFGANARASALHHSLTSSLPQIKTRQYFGSRVDWLTAASAVYIWIQFF